MYREGRTVQVRLRSLAPLPSILVRKRRHVERSASIGIIAPAHPQYRSILPLFPFLVPTPFISLNFLYPFFLLVLSSSHLSRAGCGSQVQAVLRACLRLEKPRATWPAANSLLQRHSIGRHPSLPDLAECLCQLLSQDHKVPLSKVVGFLADGGVKR